MPYRINERPKVPQTKPEYDSIDDAVAVLLAIRQANPDRDFDLVFSDPKDGAVTRVEVVTVPGPRLVQMGDTESSEATTG